MNAIIADDELITRQLLEERLGKAGYAVTACADGDAAFAALLSVRTPTLAVLDSLMPGLSGPEICRQLRATPPPAPVHLLLLTTNSTKADIVAGLQAGADDYLTKPFHWLELQARLQAGTRVLQLQERLIQRVRELEDALAQVKALKGLLPICTYCKSIRDDDNYWQQLEHYFARHAAARFSHGICPACLDAQLAQLGPAAELTI